jgi:hypothetical protein
MKKLLTITILLLTLTGCMKDEIIEPINLVEVPESLVIEDLQGLKLESTIVSDEVRMNVKLPYTGEYRIKIRDISNQLISQEKIDGNEGDNLLKVYVSSLDKDGYMIELTDNNHDVIGRTSFVVN